MKKKTSEYHYVIRLPDDLRRALRKCAEAEDRPLSRVVRAALREYISRHIRLPTA